jgi:hypothetical protein
MLEAGDIKLFAEGSGDDVQCWMAAKDSCFATRFLAIENKLWAAIAHLFLTGQIIFGVDTDPFNVRWYTRRLPVN